MKKYFSVSAFVILALSTFASINTADCLARQRYQHELTDNAKLSEANSLYGKAVTELENGDGVHESQRATQHYAAAESYLTKAVLSLKELGIKHSIDVTKEAEFCEKLNRETHAKQGMAKRESK